MAEDNKKVETKAANEAAEAKGLYEVEFTKDLGSRKKGDVVEMHHSTAKALETHKKVKIGKKVTVKKAVKEE